MNWISETYSNVYSTAMMSDQRAVRIVTSPRKSMFARLFGRG